MFHLLLLRAAAQSFCVAKILFIQCIFLSDTWITVKHDCNVRICIKLCKNCMSHNVQMSESCNVAIFSSFLFRCSYKWKAKGCRNHHLITHFFRLASTSLLLGSCSKKSYTGLFFTACLPWWESWNLPPGYCQPSLWHKWEQTALPYLTRGAPGMRMSTHLNWRKLHNLQLFIMSSVIDMLPIFWGSHGHWVGMVSV